MGVDKLSVSFDEELAGAVRRAAADEGVPVSTWLAEAAKDKVRNRLLGEALDALYAEIGKPDDAELAAILEEARRSAIVTGGTSEQAA